MSGNGRIYPPVAQRLAARTDKTQGHGPQGDCWVFTGQLVRGYGQIKRAGRDEYAHRVAYEIHHGVDLGRARETGVLVLHRCDNRACVNPAHLFLGDDKINFDDMVRKGRRVVGNQKGVANPSAKLTDDAVRAIRADHRSYEEIAEESWGLGVDDQRREALA